MCSFPGKVFVMTSSIGFFIFLYHLLCTTVREEQRYINSRNKSREFYWKKS